MFKMKGIQSLHVLLEPKVQSMHILFEAWGTLNGQSKVFLYVGMLWLWLIALYLYLLTGICSYNYCILSRMFMAKKLAGFFEVLTTKLHMIGKYQDAVWVAGLKLLQLKLKLNNILYSLCCMHYCKFGLHFRWTSKFVFGLLAKVWLCKERLCFMLLTKLVLFYFHE